MKTNFIYFDTCKVQWKHQFFSICKNKGGDAFLNGKGKVFYDQEPPSGESTTTECGVNYQLLAVMY